MAKKAVKKKTGTGRARTHPHPTYEQWSSAKFFGFIRSALRAKMRSWPPKQQSKQLAKRIYIGDNPRQKYEYQCADCKEWFKDKEIELDHIEPAGSLNCYEDLPNFVEKLFCGIDGFRCLCKPCHLRRTNEERRRKKEEKEKE